MSRYVYMNERIRQPKPAGPVIAVQTGKRVRNTNRVQVVHGGVVVCEIRYAAGGLSTAPGHHVRAFVALADHVELRYPRARARKAVRA
jgi:hypothetical protein